jgi:metal-responsive CopG/Arc/MetJ family transcriptional regulator
MGRIDVNLPDNLENKLRMEIGRRMGSKRGNFTEAIIEAIDMWLEKDKAKGK